MSHDRGCPCGLEKYEYEDCRRADCLNRPMTAERIVQDALAAMRLRKVRGGAPGNCVQCCVATILNLPLDKVPDFVNESGSDWVLALLDWLEAKGFELAVFDGYKPRLGLWMLDGRSPRGGEMNHAVVMKGSLMYHDPDSSNDFVQAARKSYWITQQDPARART